jgi:hypothetical protein
MKTGIVVWAFTLITVGIGFVIGLNGSPAVGFGLCVFGGAIPFSYEPVRDFFKKLFS